VRGLSRTSGRQALSGDEEVPRGPCQRNPVEGEQRRRAGTSQQLPQRLEGVLPGHQLPAYALLVSIQYIFFVIFAD